MIEAITSLQWQRWYYKPGEFELVCQIPKSIDDAVALLVLLRKGNIIWPKGKDEAGYINYCHLGKDDKGQETVDVKGYFLTGYTKRRIVWDSLYLTGTAETVMRTLVDKNAISPTDTKRVIPLLSLGTLHNLAPAGVYQTPTDKRDNLADALEALATAGDVGQRTLFDPHGKTMQYEVWQGLDRTVGQSANPRAIFSQEYENVLTQEYTSSDDDLKNVALVDGKYTYTYEAAVIGSDGQPEKNDDGSVKMETKEAEMPVSTTVGDSSGLNRYEEFVGSSSSSKISGTNGAADTYLSQADFMNLLTQDGSKDLAQHVKTKTFDSTINLQGNLKYQQNWDLGDMVTFVSDRWGLQLDTRITGVKEIYESSGLSLDVTFGNDVPTILDKIRKAMK
jgi:hypothetical protein